MRRESLDASHWQLTNRIIRALDVADGSPLPEGP